MDKNAAPDSNDRTAPAATNDLASRPLRRALSPSTSPKEAAARWRQSLSGDERGRTKATGALAAALLAVALPKARRSLPRYLADEAPSVAGQAVMKVLDLIFAGKAEPGHEAGLMSVAARSVALDHVRRFGPRGPKACDGDSVSPLDRAILADPTAAPAAADWQADVALERREVIEAVRHLLRPGGPLRPRYRELIVRHDLDGEPLALLIAEEVEARAKRLGRPLDPAELKQARNVIDRGLSRARAALRHLCVLRKLSPLG